MGKLIRFSLASLAIFLLFGVIFSLSSKADPVPGNSGPCVLNINGNLQEAYIQINFEPGCNNPFRRTGYECYIPSPDLRLGDVPPGSGTTYGLPKFNGKVLVTSPNCKDFAWAQFMTPQTITSGGKMLIKLPPPGYEVTLKVTYSEEYDNAANNFNVPPNSQTDQSSVLYTFERTYFSGWDKKIPQPIFLKASRNSPPPPPPTSGKKAAIQDYKDLNDYMRKNGLFGN